MPGVSVKKPLEIKRLKDWSISALPPSSTLRNVLLQEDDELSVEEFLIKSTMWMKLARLEESSIRPRARMMADLEDSRGERRGTLG